MSKKTKDPNPHAVALGRLGGFASAKSITQAKSDAARENGKKGGRPRKHPKKPQRGVPQPDDLAR